MTRTHVPVLAAEVIELGDPGPGDTVVDCTFGAGGHARLIADRIGPAGTLVGIDRDPAAEERFEELAGEVACDTRFVRASYADGLGGAGRGGPPGRSGAVRPGRLVHAAGRARAGLLLLLRRAAGHAHGPDRGPLGRRPDRRARARPPGPGLPHLRRGAPRPADRARDRPPALARADRDDGRAGRGHRGRGTRPGTTRLRRRPSGAAGVPGAADRGQRRARRARPRAADRLRAAAPRRPTWRPSPSTRSRIAASSASWPTARGAASARRTSRSAPVAASPRPRWSPAAPSHPAPARWPTTRVRARAACGWRRKLAAGEAA